MKGSFESLPTRDILILQQIHESGEDDATALSQELHESRAKIIARLHALRQKGLVVIRDVYGEIIVSLSPKGLGMVKYLWSNGLTV